MIPPADRFPDIRAADLRAIHRLTGHLMEAADLSMLGREMIRGAASILPADLMLWNVWTLGMDQMLSLESNSSQYCEVLERHSDALGATIQHHPVILAGQLENAVLRPQRMSDYQSSAAFRENPLYRDVYRHVDSRHQIAYNAIRLEDSQIILSWNMENRDFDDREMQLLHLLGLQVAALSRRLEERRHLHRVWSELAAALGNHSHATAAESPPLPLLGAKDGHLLSALIGGKARTDIAAALGWRRDTLDRHLAVLRERLGYENTPQLLLALAALRPGCGKVPKTPVATPSP